MTTALRAALLTLLSPLSLAAQAAAPARHALDPLSADEIRAATSALRADARFPANAGFALVALREPPKADVLRGAVVPREAEAVLVDRRGGGAIEAVVDLDASRVTAWRRVPGAQPLFLQDEYETAAELASADPRWQAALRRRNLDPSRVHADGWAAAMVPAEHRARRVMRVLAYMQDGAINFFGRPIENVEALVDLNAHRVLSVTDGPIVPTPRRGQEFDTASTGTRPAPAPLTMAHPGGASFVRDGNEVRWQGWRFRWSMHPREGLVLHTVGYEDGGRVRPILYRGSLSEMMVPYGDPATGWRWRAAFDVGEYGIGRMASPLERGTDVPAYATLIDATFAGDSGEVVTVPGAVALYERDGGLLWKHYDGYTGKNESRRARQLVASFIATIGNYDYAVNWVFHQDGTLETEAVLTGIMLAKGVADTTAAHRSGLHLVAPNVVAPHHQHFFGFRLDLDVDGPRNAVVELNTRAQAAGAANPAGNGIVTDERPLRTERAARRSMDLGAARVWGVVSADARNALGAPTAYLLVPGANGTAYLAPAAAARRRAQFIGSHFWATRYAPDERFAAGEYPNQSLGGDGLPRFVADDASLANEDVVVWYTLGVTHVPRPEEWPVMPAAHVGFRLVPANFFARNPALDVPR